MLRSNRFTFRGKLLSFLLLASMPLMTGCDPLTVSATTFGATFWLDIALTPIRSLLGGAALNFVNTF